MKLYIVHESHVQDHTHKGGEIDMDFLTSNASEVIDGDTDCVSMTTRLITLINNGDDDVFCYLTDGVEIYHS